MTRVGVKVLAAVADWSERFEAGRGRAPRVAVMNVPGCTPDALGGAMMAGWVTQGAEWVTLTPEGHCRARRDDVRALVHLQRHERDYGRRAA
jgi:hypothetical protein